MCPMRRTQLVGECSIEARAGYRTDQRQQKAVRIHSAGLHVGEITLVNNV